ncbi:MAG: hypothetical protein ABI947_18705 [Chloroflexota bacterium]
MSTTIPIRPNALPKNYPAVPAVYPTALFRLQVEAVQRYLYETELKEILTEAAIPLDVLNVASRRVMLTVAHSAVFMQALQEIIDDDKAVDYGHEAFIRCASMIPRSANIPFIQRTLSSGDRQNNRIRESLAGFNHETGMNVSLKWRDSGEFDLLDDAAQHCYGYIASTPICHIMTGYLEESIFYLLGAKVALAETNCMALGAATCCWHGTFG